MNKEQFKRKLRIMKRKKWPFALIALLIVAIVAVPVISSVKSSSDRLEAKTPIPLTDILIKQTEREKITLVAHRGYSAQAPENTLPAIQKAAEFGFDYVEIDVRQTKDGVWVLMHDSDIKTVCDKKGKVSSFTYYDLVPCNIVKGANAEEYTDLKIPTFEQALKTCLEFNVIPMIEIKDYSREGLESLLKLVEKYGFTKTCSVISFHREAVEIVRELNPEIKLYKLVSKLNKDEMELCLANPDMGVSFNGNEKSNTPEKVKQLQAAGIPLACWTVDTAETMQKWVEEGITTFVTNRIYYHN
ncbi:MAG: hypothetical protein IJ447_04170 [Clostridia bacterium]|nr:hypothetical protein [Clostridia bacterium]